MTIHFEEVHGPRPELCHYCVQGLHEHHLPLFLTQMPTGERDSIGNPVREAVGPFDCECLCDALNRTLIVEEFVDSLAGPSILDETPPTEESL